MRSKLSVAVAHRKAQQSYSKLFLIFVAVGLLVCGVSHASPSQVSFYYNITNMNTNSLGYSHPVEILGNSSSVFSIGDIYWVCNSGISGVGAVRFNPVTSLTSKINDIGGIAFCSWGFYGSAVGFPTQTLDFYNNRTSQYNPISYNQFSGFTTANATNFESFANSGNTEDGITYDFGSQGSGAILYGVSTLGSSTNFYVPAGCKILLSTVSNFLAFCNSLTGNESFTFINPGGSSFSAMSLWVYSGSNITAKSFNNYTDPFPPPPPSLNFSSEVFFQNAQCTIYNPLTPTVSVTKPISIESSKITVTELNGSTENYTSPYLSESPLLFSTAGATTGSFVSNFVFFNFSSHENINISDVWYEAPTTFSGNYLCNGDSLCVAGLQWLPMNFNFYFPQKFLIDGKYLSGLKS